MKLSREAESYYMQLLGIKVSEIEEVCQPELRHAKEFMPRGGARAYAIADAILKRWRMMAEARMDCWLAAYRRFDIKLEKADAVEFAREKFDGSRHGILNSFVAHAGGGIASNHFVNQFEQINRETRAKLLVAVTDFELERKEAKKRKKEEKRRMRKEKEGEFLMSKHTALRSLKKNSVPLAVKEPTGGGEVEIHGFKVSSDGTGKSYFMVLEQLEIARDSIITSEGSSDYWKVLYTEEFGVKGEFYYLKVFVEKVSKTGTNLVPSQGNTVFSGPVIGVQVGGQGNTQIVSINISQAFDGAIAELRNHIATSPLDEEDKLDALEALDRLPRLAEKKDSPGVIERAKTRLDELVRIIGLSADLYTIAPPLLTVLYNHFQLPFK